MRAPLSKPHSETLRVHGVAPASLSNGPGKRFTIWLQGCGLSCPGCFNPETHDASGGQVISTEDLARRIETAAPELRGISITGGEPLEQAKPLGHFLHRVRSRTELDIILFTGFSPDEIESMPEAKKTTDLADLVIAGRYDASRRLAHGLLGSSNQVMLFQNERFNSSELDDLPEAEIILEPDGHIVVTGIDPPKPFHLN